MEVRIKFSAEVYVKGEDMSEIKSKFEMLPLFSADALEDNSAEFGEILLVEDAETYKDLRKEYDEV
jgi:hypothetical protein